MRSQELQDFEKWYEQNAERAPRAKAIAYGAMKSDVDVATLLGDNVKHHMARGSLMLWADRLVFLPASGSAPVIWIVFSTLLLGVLVLGTVIGFYTGRTPYFLAAGAGAAAWFGMNALHKRTLDPRNSEEVLEVAADEDSISIELGRIRSVSATQRENTMLRPRLALLEVAFVTDDGKQDAAIFASRIDGISRKHMEFDPKPWMTMLQADPAQSPR